MELCEQILTTNRYFINALRIILMWSSFLTACEFFCTDFKETGIQFSDMSDFCDQCYKKAAVLAIECSP